MSHGTGMGNYIRAGTKNPVSTPVSNGDYTMIDDYNLENGYGEDGVGGYYEADAGQFNYNDRTRRKKRKYYNSDESDSDSDSGSDSDDDSDVDSDFEDSGYGKRRTLSDKINGYNGLISILCLVLLIVIMWFIYHIRKDIDSMFGE